MEKVETLIIRGKANLRRWVDLSVGPQRSVGIGRRSKKVTADLPCLYGDLTDCVSLRCCTDEQRSIPQRGGVRSLMLPDRKTNNPKIRITSEASLAEGK